MSRDVRAFTAEMSKTLQPEAMTASVKPNGQTKRDRPGKAANGYGMGSSMPSMVGGEEKGRS